MIIDRKGDEKGIVIHDVQKEYVEDDKFMKYLGVTMGSGRVSKMKIIKSKI
jgi:hypothetical protein